MGNKKVNLEEILKKQIDTVREDVTGIGSFEWISPNTSIGDVLRVMEEACKQILELATENATMELDLNTGGIIINTDSILNTINQIE